jgi:ABC-type nitrate/sulfonate/bicarbonate transport system permease component
MAVWQKTLAHTDMPRNEFEPSVVKVGQWTQVALVPLTLAGFVGLWALFVKLSGYPPFILPGPERVWARFLTLAADGVLWRHTATTLSEVLAGLALGMAVAFVLGYLLSRSRTVERLVAPYIVASQSIPIVAIAPLLVIWFGAGATSKIIVSALIVFFPILISSVAGLRSAEPDLLDLMCSLEATRWQTFAKLELPAAIPMIVSGLKVGATLSVIGAVVGEFVGADRGLGFLVKQGQGLYDTPLMFVAVLALVVIAMSLYGLVALIERYLLAWKQ